MKDIYLRVRISFMVIATKHNEISVQPVRENINRHGEKVVTYLIRHQLTGMSTSEILTPKKCAN